MVAITRPLPAMLRDTNRELSLSVNLRGLRVSSGTMEMSALVGGVDTGDAEYRSSLPLGIQAWAKTWPSL